MSVIEFTHGDEVEIDGETVRVGIDGNFSVVDRGAEPPDARVMQHIVVLGMRFSIVWIPYRETKEEPKK